jgi:hypothetical protein
MLLLDRWYYILIVFFSNTWSRGEHISIPTTWKNLSSGSFDASVFSQDQIDALNLATEPSAGNPYATEMTCRLYLLKGQIHQQTYY